jgi:hypothetical protein
MGGPFFPRFYGRGGEDRLPADVRGLRVIACPAVRYVAARRTVVGEGTCRRVRFNPVTLVDMVSMADKPILGRAIFPLSWLMTRSGSDPHAPCRQTRSDVGSSDAIRRARALRGVWRRCSLLISQSRDGYAHHRVDSASLTTSALASHRKARVLLFLLFMRWLLVRF